MPWPGEFPDKVNTDIDVIDEALVQCYLTSCKNTFVGAGNLQMITSKFWSEYLSGPYVLFLDPVLCIALVCLEDEAFNPRSWLHEKKLAS